MGRLEIEHIPALSTQDKRKFAINKIRKLLDYKDNSVSKTEINHWLNVLEGKA